MAEKTDERRVRDFRMYKEGKTEVMEGGNKEGKCAGY